MFRSTPSTRLAKRDRAAALGRLQTRTLDWWETIKGNPLTTLGVTLMVFGFIIVAHVLVSLIPV